MTPIALYNLFITLFPQHIQQDNVWYPNGKNSIRIKESNGRELIFTYTNETDWRLETMKSFMRGMKK